MFELPVVIFFLARIGIVTADFLKKKRKYALLLTFVIGAVLTPPDPMSQLMMAGPLIILYEVGIAIARIAEKKESLEDEVAEDEGS